MRRRVLRVQSKIPEDSHKKNWRHQIHGFFTTDKELFSPLILYPFWRKFHYSHVPIYIAKDMFSFIPIRTTSNASTSHLSIPVAGIICCSKLVSNTTSRRRRKLQPHKGPTQPQSEHENSPRIALNDRIKSGSLRVELRDRKNYL